MKTPPADLTARLLAASPQLLRPGGVPRFDDVAELVEVSRATLYYYFSGRDDLLAFLLTAHVEEGAAVMAAADPVDASVPERLRAMVAAVVAYLAERPAMCSGLLAAASAEGSLREVLAVNDAHIARPIRELITIGIADGVLDVPDATDAANALLGACLLAVIGRDHGDGHPAASGLPDALASQLVRGLAAD